jgi:hypothetical protein
MPDNTVALIAERMNKGGQDSWLDVIEIDAATGEVLSGREVIQAAKHNGWHCVTASLVLR